MKNSEHPKPRINSDDQAKEFQSLSEAVKIKKMHLDAGLLGKIFGNSETAPTNICGIVAFLLIVTGTIMIFYESKVDPFDYWKSIIVPLLSVMLGYLFGRGQR
jgi:hypothetical protein